MFLPALLALTLAAKAVVLAQLHGHPLLQPTGGLDSQAYVSLARRVAAGDLALAPAPYYLAPLYVYFLAAVLAVSNGSLLAVKVAQVLLGTGAVAVVYATARHWGGAVAARAAAVLTAATGVFAFSEVLLLQSALDPFLTALALFLLARALVGHESPGGPRGRSFLAAGAGFGLLALNRPNALGVAVALAVLFALTAVAQRSRAGLRRAGAFALGGALLIAPMFARNLVVAGEPILISSHGGLNFYIGNNADADGTYRHVPGVTPDVAGQAQDAQRMAEQAAGRELTAREASDWFYARAFEWIAAHPGDALRLFARKLAYVFNAAELALNFSFPYYAHDERTLLGALGVGAWLLLPLGLVGLLARAADRPRGPFLLWAAFVPLYALSVAAFFVSGRYRQPLLVPLAIGAGLLVERAWRAARAGRGRTLAGFAAATLAAAAATNWHLGLDDGRAEERSAMIEHLIDAGRLDDALRRLERAERESPQPAQILYRAGRALHERGEARRAAEILRRALLAEPGRADTQLALGQALLDAGDARGAIAPLRAARDAGARPEPAAFDLARALAALGREQEARGVLRELGGDVRGDASSLFALGDLALQLGEPALAERHLRGSLDAAGAGVPAAHQARTREKLGAALSLQSRSPEALRELDEACRLDPTSASAHLNRAVALTQLARFADARAAVGEALRLKPDYPQALGLREELERRPRRSAR